MNQEQFDALSGDPAKLLDALKAEKKDIKFDDYRKQYNSKDHKINDPIARRDKIVNTNGGAEPVPVTRLPIPMQKKITQTAATFLCANPIKIDAPFISDAGDQLVSVVRKVIEDNKMIYLDMQIAEKLFSETEVAEIWYAEELETDSDYWMGTANEGKVNLSFRVKIISNSTGDELLPTFNEHGDMIAFARLFKSMIEGKDTERLTVYTATQISEYVKTDNGWTDYDGGGPNPVQKIPVVYYTQEHPEWYEVQEMIERFEISNSNHADTNDYFGSPMVKLEGDVKGFAKKGEEGKVIQLAAGAKAEYMTWDQSPESVKLEQENLRSLIMDFSDTPDLSFTQMSKLGTFSGFAIKLLFTSAHMKAARKEQIFGIGVQRRLNFLKSAMITVNPAFEAVKMQKMKPMFEYYLPKDIAGEIDVLANAIDAGILSKETAIEKNPLIADPEIEKQRIEDERQAAELSEQKKLDNIMNDKDTNDDPTVE
jgi:SPP1 family phage portal protein